MSPQKSTDIRFMVDPKLSEAVDVSFDARVDILAYVNCGPTFADEQAVCANTTVRTRPDLIESCCNKNTASVGATLNTRCFVVLGSFSGQCPSFLSTQVSL